MSPRVFSLVLPLFVPVASAAQDRNEFWTVTSNGSGGPGCDARQITIELTLDAATHAAKGVLLEVGRQAVRFTGTAPGLFAFKTKVDGEAGESFEINAFLGPRDGRIFAKGDCYFGGRASKVERGRP